MTEQTIKASFRQLRIARRRYTGSLVFLFLLLGSLMLLMLMWGNTVYSPAVVWKVLVKGEISDAVFTLRTLRLPRMLCGVLAGFAFGMAGCTFQTLLRNPLASPDVIGISSGASAAAVFCILVLGWSGTKVSAAAVVCGLFISAGIYLIARKGGFSGGRLILIGIGVQAIMNAVISYLLQKASRYDVPGALRWMSGSLNGMKIEQVLPLLVMVVAGLLIFTVNGKQLLIMELGEEFSIALGVRTNRTRLCLILTAVVLIGTATAVTGPISFVAFLSGPIARRIAGPGVKLTIPAGLTGAVLILISDLAGQFLTTGRYPVGVITGLLGAPCLLLLLIQINRKGGNR